MPNVTSIYPDEVLDALMEYGSMGGVMDIKLYQVSGADNERESHLLVAQRKMEDEKEDSDSYFINLANELGSDRSKYFQMTLSTINREDGKQLKPQEFFGPYCDVIEQRPILRGRSGTSHEGYVVHDLFFYYDDPEAPETAIDTKSISIDSYPRNNDFATIAYADAFLEPVHSFGGSESNFDKGRFFLKMSHLLFGNFKDMIVYAWPVDCSNYFDAGKEWWGSFFWTIYNPSHDWYIGITASTTD